MSFFSDFEGRFNRMKNEMSGRRYNKGWTPSTKPTTKYRSTIRDIGRGSGQRSEYVPRKEEDVPQTYDEVKQACIESGSLWEDPDFPAEDDSMFFKEPPSPYPNIEWLRPKEICDGPELFVGGATRMDINQGVLGDCWLLAATAGLACNSRLLHRVIPDGQSFEDGDYGGVFKFALWQYGRWVEVLIDDRLPCSNGKLIYMHSDNRNEFWSALLEKAYAKVNGSYEALNGGLTSEALTDFTGGIVERINMRQDPPADLLNLMLKAVARGALLGCSIDATPDQMEAHLDNGLVIGHAYTITDVRLCDIETPSTSGKIPMVRVRNPWGDSHEWNGPFSDGSEEWSFIPDEQKQELGLTFEDDGESWMSFNDWKREFMRLEICYLGPDTLIDEDDASDEVVKEIKKWEGTLHEGLWQRRVNAGGCRNYPQSFWTNPQYRVTIADPDEDDEDGNGSIIVGLMQKNRRKLRAEGKDNTTIGYAIYKLDDPNCGTLDNRFFQTNMQAGKSPSFINTREICDHHKMPPGDYVIVPSTFEPNDEAEFILRVFSENKDDVQELDDATGTTDPEEEELGEDAEDEADKAAAGQAKFEELAGDNGELDAYEIKDILNEIYTQEFEFDGFSIDICRSMVAMNDKDLSGQLGFEDFQQLWEDLKLCKKTFKALDADGNGFFNSYELKRALKILGLRVSNATFNAIVMRYSDKEGHVKFDDFVACVIKLKSMFQTFKAKEGAPFAMDEFIQMTMYS